MKLTGEERVRWHAEARKSSGAHEDHAVWGRLGTQGSQPERWTPIQAKPLRRHRFGRRPLGRVAPPRSRNDLPEEDATVSGSRSTTPARLNRRRADRPVMEGNAPAVDPLPIWSQTTDAGDDTLAGRRPTPWADTGHLGRQACPEGEVVRTGRETRTAHPDEIETPSWPQRANAHAAATPVVPPARASAAGRVRLPWF